MAKKKIKDITLAEAERLCDRHYDCKGCPAFDGKHCFFNDWNKHSEYELEVE